MNVRKKWVLLCLLILITAVFFAGCKGENVYQDNDKLGYNVSVRYDANGGSFVSGNTPAIVDSFNVSEMKKNSEGKVEIALLAPETRKNITMQNNDLFLIGWYQQRIENSDGTYTYAKPWNFETDRVIVDPNAKYSSEEPVMTLYAAWAPQFTVEFFNMDSAEKESLGTLQLPPNVSLEVPGWNEETGAMDMGGFPALEGFTYTASYYDAEGKTPVEGETLTHTGAIDLETGTVENPNMKIYISWTAGNWYKIYTAQQFKDNFSLSGCYDIQADLDFTDVIWPTSCMHGDFSGIIQGNGHTFSNIAIEQTNANKMNTGLFGNLTASASVSNIIFDNVTLTISKGSRLSGVTYGLLAGNLALDSAAQNIQFRNCQIIVSADAYLQPDSYSIGLICGMGTSTLDPAGISCDFLGESAEAEIPADTGEETAETENAEGEALPETEEATEPVNNPETDAQ